MADSLQKQKEDLEKELAKTGDDRPKGNVRDALESQLTAIKKKLTAQKNKTVDLDGTLVNVGSTVYIIDYPRLTYSARKAAEKEGVEPVEPLPIIIARKVCAISNDGEQICASGCSAGWSGRVSHNYYNIKGGRWETSPHFFPSIDKAHAAIIAEQRKVVEGKEVRLKEAQEELAEEQARLQRILAKANASDFVQQTSS